MPLPRAFIPLRHPAFRMLWIANLASNIGLWVQNTGAGWLMTTLSPSPIMVSLVQAASMLPVFMLAVPAGALADIMDRRTYLLMTQGWLAAVAVLLCVMDLSGVLGPWGLLGFTFALGAGLAMSFPGWAATTPELVPREDFVGAIALNGIGFNIARALGPAIGGVIIASYSTAAAFAFNALCILTLAGALLMWKREPTPRHGPRENFLSAIRAGLRFVAATPAMRSAIIRACMFFLFGAAVWGLLPLLVRQELGLGPQAFGLMLGAMGAGAVTAGFLMPSLRGRMNRSQIVWAASALSAFAMAVIAAAALLGLGWAAAGLGIFLYGMAWLAAASTLQAAASLAAPNWVRARAMGIYQMGFFGAMTLGSAVAGWIGEHAGSGGALALFAACGLIGGFLVRGRSLDAESTSYAATATQAPSPAPAADALRPLLTGDSGRVLEVVRYQVAPESRAGFLAHMEEVRRVRLRAGAATWRLYEDVARPERYVELWSIESWTEHLREEARMTETDRAIVAAAMGYDRSAEGPEAVRYLHVV